VLVNEAPGSRIPALGVTDRQRRAGPVDGGVQETVGATVWPAPLERRGYSSVLYLAS